ncbi:MAG: DUF1294 domain-containing protein [Sandarakinorhabdus sp.]|nr:DUF1294 domain-containing protein [Sandarakinorhabdus sp.]
MPASLILAAAAAAAVGSFACENPRHHDGDNVRCDGLKPAIRLEGIDAPEMPGACRPGRECTPGDPFAARDALRALTQGRSVICTQQDRDRYGRIIARCSADGIDLSCAMIAAGHAVPRYVTIDCPDGTTRPADLLSDRKKRRGGGMLATLWGLPGLLLMLLLVVNIAAWAAFAIDKRRATAGRSRERIPEATLLGLALLGGSPAAWWAMQRLRHKTRKEPFKTSLLLITGVQIGLLLGGLWWWLGG